MKLIPAHERCDREISASLKRIIENIEPPDSTFRVLEETFFCLLEVIQDYVIALINPDGIVAITNAGTKGLIGYSSRELEGTHYSVLFPNRDISTGIPEELLHRASSSGHAHDERQWMKRDGSRFWGKMELIGIRDPSRKIIGYSMVLRDLNQQALSSPSDLNPLVAPGLIPPAHPSKPDAKPCLPASPGGQDRSFHNLNNVLTSLLGYSELALADSSVEGRMGRYLGEIHEAALRAKELTKESPDPGHEDRPASSSTKLFSFMENIVEMLRVALPDQLPISLITHVKEGADGVQANGNQICHVLMPIYTHALEVLKNQRGELRVSLASQTLSAKKSDGSTVLKGGLLMEFHIMEKEERDDGSERVVSTSSPSRRPKSRNGGLDSARRMVEELGGDLQWKDLEHNHQLISVLLPRSKANAGDFRLTYSPHYKNPEHILVVDDEESVASLLKEMLTQLGYMVDVAETGEQAMRIFLEDPRRFDLVLTDHTLPRMTGNSLVKDLLDCRPDLPIILCSGWSHATEQERIQELGVKRFLPKPVEFEELSRVVRLVLDQHSSAS